MNRLIVSLALLAWLLAQAPAYAQESKIDEEVEKLRKQLEEIADLDQKLMVPMRDGVKLATDIYLPAKDGKEALARLDREAEAGNVPAVVLSDVKMPRLDGVGLLEAVVARERPPAVIMVSGHGDIATAVDALKKGAVDFITEHGAGGPVAEASGELELLAREPAAAHHDTGASLQVGNILKRVFLQQ